MTDALIAITAAFVAIALMLYAYRRQGKELAEETHQRRRWQKIAHAHADVSKEWEQTAHQLYAQRSETQGGTYSRPEHHNCRCTILPGDHTPVSYMSINGELTKPYIIGKSPFSIN